MGSAMYYAQLKLAGAPAPIWDDLTEPQKGVWIMLADAAIDALAEPSDEMVRAGKANIPAGHGQAWVYFGDAWTAAIKAAKAS